ncbi:MAG: alpha/beta hydrolase [Planctomycetaceae bacterium]
MASVAPPKATGARRIHVIAHSMGNRLVAESIRRLSYYYESGQIPKFNEIILTAPDIDAGRFRKRAVASSRSLPTG